MARMQVSRLFALVGLSVLAVASTGCVSQERYNAKSMECQALNEQMANLQSTNSGLAAQNDVLKQQFERMRNAGDNTSALMVNQADENAELRRQLAELDSKYRAAVEGIGKAGASPLPIALTHELTTFAAQNPEVVDFDEKSGMVKFKSDVTFSPGSAEVRPETAAVIARFASIVNGPVASQYDLLVVGHTDDVPVSNPATIRAGHHDNWFLSAHRAIGVGKQLRAQNVSARRLMVAGCADQRPVAPNDGPTNRARNRRVEVVIVPHSAAKAAPVAAAAPAPAAPAPAAPVRQPNKDFGPGAATVEIDRRPSVNK